MNNDWNLMTSPQATTLTREQLLQHQLQKDQQQRQLWAQEHLMQQLVQQEGRDTQQAYGQKHFAHQLLSTQPQLQLPFQPQLHAQQSQFHPQLQHRTLHYNTNEFSVCSSAPASCSYGYGYDRGVTNSTLLEEPGVVQESNKIPHVENFLAGSYVETFALDASGMPIVVRSRSA
jgi:hypothetical protein